MNYGPTKEKIPLSIMLSSSGHIVRREAMWPVSQENTRSLRTDKVVSNIIMGVQPGRASCWVQPRGSWASTEVLLGSHLGLALGPDGPNSTQFLVK